MGGGGCACLSGFAWVRAWEREAVVVVVLGCCVLEKDGASCALVCVEMGPRGGGREGEEAASARALGSGGGGRSSAKRRHSSRSSRS